MFDNYWIERAVQCAEKITGTCNMYALPWSRSFLSLGLCLDPVLAEPSESGMAPTRVATPWKSSNDRKFVTHTTTGGAGDSDGRLNPKLNCSMEVATVRKVPARPSALTKRRRFRSWYPHNQRPLDDHCDDGDDPNNNSDAASFARRRRTNEPTNERTRGSRTQTLETHTNVPTRGAHPS